MTVQDILNNARAKKKLQAGGQASGTVEGIQNDLVKKTIRDDAMVAQAQGIAGGAASPSLDPAAQKKAITPGGGPAPMHVIIDNADEMGGGAGGGLTGMVNKFAGKLVGKGLGAVGAFFNKTKNRNVPAQPATVPAAQDGKKLIPKAQGGSDFGVTKIKNIYNPAAMGLPQSPGLQTMTQQPVTNQQIRQTKRDAGLGFGNKLKDTFGNKGAFNLAGGLSGAGNLIGGAMDALKPQGPMNTWGIETQTKKGNRMAVAGSAAKGAAQGAAAMASTGNPFLIAGGAAFGLVKGFISGKKQVKEEAKQIKDSTQLAYEGYHQKANADQYAALAKHGAKIDTMKKIKSVKTDKISMKSRKFKVGGKLNRLGEVNIIPSGTLHKENNNLGQKDKGLPIIDKDGKKVFEIEKEEIIFRLKATKSIEDLTDKYKKSHNDKHLIELGKLLSEEINNNTHDFSGRYGLEV